MPGQFLTFAFPVGGSTVHRCYTIATPPTRPDLVGITVKRVPGGPVSNWLHDGNLKPGDVVRASGPMGDFSSWLGGGQKWLFLAGGVGVTPLMSMARAAFDLGQDPDLILVQAARTPADLVFRDELALMARRRPGLRTAHLVEAAGSEPEWAGHRGRLSEALLRTLAPDLAEREVFCCGPAPFMAAVRSILAGLGYDMGHYREESFNFEELPAAERAAVAAAGAGQDAEEAAASAPASFEIRFAKSDRAVRCGAEQTILDAARKAGLRLPASCTKGICGTCKSRKLGGEVEMRHGGGIRQREIDAGMVLLCCSRPRSDVVIER
jgi:ferredoxin-NADP reductase